jgi:hypothetical protein
VFLSNEVAPVQVLVSEDGQRVVTLDNWHRFGYGDEVVAIYSLRGQVRRYSLEQALEGLVPGGESLWDRFDHSVSSRHWRRESDARILELLGEPHACIWLEWAQAWLAFRLADGRRIESPPGLRPNLQTPPREWAIAQCRDGRDPVTGARYLLSLARPEDLPVVSAGLARAESVSLDSLLRQVDAAGLARLTGIPGLRSLVIPPHAAPDIPDDQLLAGIAALTSLQELHLSDPGITDAGMPRLRALRGLRRLRLDGTGITDAGLAELGTWEANLEFVGVGGTRVTPAGVAALRASRPGLTVVGP